MSGKYALIIGNTEYNDPGLAQLTAPGKDAEDFSRVLNDREICGFEEVKLLLNQPEYIVRGAIDEFFDQKKPDDLLVLYFSGHGVRDEIGSLYLAVKNTLRTRLRSTAIKSDYIREAMDQSRSRRQVLILDCCNSGAFEQGTKAATGVSLGTASAFEAGYGRIILTASDSTQFAWEGDQVMGESDNSLFTHFLVEGLEGEADLDGDGQITVDELYDYVFEKVKLATPKQSPSKFSSKQQGEIVLRQHISPEDIKYVPLPEPLIDSIENPFAEIRLAAVQQLAKLMNGKNLGLARSAREALERMAENDDSRQVSRAASQALGIAQQAGQPAIQKQVEETLPPPAETDKPLVLETHESAAMPNWQALITLGWAMNGMFAGFLWSEFDGVGGSLIGGVIGGGGGGLITALILRYGKVLSEQISTIRCVLVWALAGTLGWWIGLGLLTEAIGAAIGMAIFAIIGLVGTLGMESILSNWKNIAAITLGWAIGGGIGWSISRGLIEGSGVDHSTSWAIGTAIGWAIGGFVLGWQLLKLNQKDR